MQTSDHTIDLHIHTTCSDGQYTPARVVAMAQQKGIAQMAIADHDTVAGVAEGAAAAADAGIPFVPALEISTKGARELHILGYGVDCDNAGLQAMCEEFARQRNLRGQRILDYLITKGVLLTMDQVRMFAGGKLVGRPHFAQAIVEEGYVDTVRQAFDRYLATPEFDAVERPKPTPEVGIGIIHGAGGLAVLAHPGKLTLDDEAEETLHHQLIDAGLDGIECYYSGHTAQQTLRYQKLAKRYNLLVTAGSDFHGEKVKPDVTMGLRVPGWVSFSGKKQGKQR